jgi:acyl carrier protein phosphodiesterase
LKRRYFIQSILLGFLIAIFASNYRKMNFLAHLYLSGEEEEVMIGNFIADNVKGKQFSQYSEGVAKGIWLHRQIDTFTDQHEIVRQSKARLQEKYRHYAGVIVDIFYDHFLAVNWEKYHSVDLQTYGKKVHQIIETHHAILPQKSAYFFQYMLLHNIFDGYAKIEGIQRVLTGMSRRTSFVSGMETSTQSLVTHYQDFKAEFEAFFPILIQFVEEISKEK